ncbi:hypothetical protein BV20DRAFT_525649 [Pilatotrama ljubarskyi]|nr:hypothetical protein BV20DRAFT_525649 [Pilatotrama ljubarskyi]
MCYVLCPAGASRIRFYYGMCGSAARKPNHPSPPLSASPTTTRAAFPCGGVWRKRSRRARRDVDVDGRRGSFLSRVEWRSGLSRYGGGGGGHAGVEARLTSRPVVGEWNTSLRRVSAWRPRVGAFCLLCTLFSSGFARVRVQGVVSRPSILIVCLSARPLVCIQALLPSSPFVPSLSHRHWLRVDHRVLLFITFVLYSHQAPRWSLLCQYKQWVVYGSPGVYCRLASVRPSPSLARFRVQNTIRRLSSPSSSSTEHAHRRRQ